MKHFKNTWLMLGLSTSLFTVSCSRNHYPADNFKNLPNDVVLTWNEVAYEGFGGVTYQHSLMASRVNAMVHIAMFDALNAVYPKYVQYAYTGKDSGADPIAAAATAAHAVLLHEIPGRKSFLDSALQQSISTISNEDAKNRGIKLGKEVAQAIIAARSGDQSEGNPIAPVPVTDIPGK